MQTKVQAPEVPYQCTVCKKIFRSKKGLKEHAVVHDPSLKKAQCTECALKFRDNNHLKRHIQSAHGQPGSPPTGHTCEMCNWVGYSKATLERHQKTHRVCQICNRRFRTFFLALKHKRLHDRNLKCPICENPPAMFLYERIYLKHLKKHRAELRREIGKIDRRENGEPSRRKSLPSRSHQCFNCAKNFINRWLLNRHLKQECRHLEIPPIRDFFMDHFEVQYNQALKGCVAEYHLTPIEYCANEKVICDLVTRTLKPALVWLNEQGIMVKWGYKAEAHFVRLNSEGEFEEKKALFTHDEHAQTNMEEAALGVYFEDIK